MRRERLIRFFSVTVVLAMIVLLHYVGVLRPIEQLVRDLVRPNAALLYEMTVRLAEDEELVFDSPEALQEAYKELYWQYQDAQVEQAKLALLVQENEELKARVRYLDQEAVTPVTTAVIGTDLEAIGSTLMVGIGGAAGIQEGDPVIVGEGILVGLVRDVEEDVAVIRLLTDNQSKVATMLLNNDQSIGVVEGNHGISMTMNFVPQNEILSIGDVVVSSGLEANIPAGLLVGKIRSIQKEPFRPFQRADISAPISFEKIRVVTILMNTQGE